MSTLFNLIVLVAAACTMLGSAITVLSYSLEALECVWEDHKDMLSVYFWKHRYRRFRQRLATEGALAALLPIGKRVGITLALAGFITLLVCAAVLAIVDAVAVERGDSPSHDKSPTADPRIAKEVTGNVP